MTIYIKVKKSSGNGRQKWSQVNLKDPSRIRPTTLPYISLPDPGLSPATDQRI
ncbi:MAG: hypothetical protein UV74_C0013G0054 [Candidatus Woesebacteria bacterium GW2011_GWB1_43_14]|uniref:Uncharacterized protein n=1 Tax=Candidatus Woesebacteria bacterium GW2011_GWB1_43_14 TaxID=1618578 RepID=A0A0G1DH63_9BACT|nr:MAG: hypothetical protein UV51_C0005G0169 [Candidatus Woesebacteria bacterium GW2011_GWC1_42_9]KKS96932.1 MAG: hypothetical protein UV74_C0013G0054 [Candidatus Woesebacteria bacterium GW2011_GWB1_43_14]